MAKKKKRPLNKKQKKLSLKHWLFVLVGIAVLIVFLPTTALLIVGMIPTMVAFVVDRQPGRNKTFTIGVMNFAGCFSYVLDIWLHANSINYSLFLLTQPKTYVVMYAAAAIGYVIDWGITLIVSAILVQRSEMRLKKIEKEKEALAQRWGKDVDGLQTLDEKGFATELGSQQKKA